MSANNILDIHKIREILPHRYPFLLVDRVTELTPGKYLSAYKNVTTNEPFFTGHFPNRPVFPGVLIVEALAQASAILVSQSVDATIEDNVIFLLAGIDKARFKRPVEPGDQLVLEVTHIQGKSKIWKCDTRAMVDDTFTASASVIFTYRVI